MGGGGEFLCQKDHLSIVPEFRGKVRIGDNTRASSAYRYYVNNICKGLYIILLGKGYR